MISDTEPWPFKVIMMNYSSERNSNSEEII